MLASVPGIFARVPLFCFPLLSSFFSGNRSGNSCLRQSQESLPGFLSFRFLCLPLFSWKGAADSLPPGLGNRVVPVAPARPCGSRGRGTPPPSGTDPGNGAKQLDFAVDLFLLRQRFSIRKEELGSSDTTLSQGVIAKSSFSNVLLRCFRRRLQHPGLDGHQNTNVLNS